MEDKKIKKYLINFTEKQLNKCKAFTKVYGKKFARERLELNIDKVYIEQYNKNGINGDYNIENKKIRIYTHYKDSKLTTLKDIKRDFVIQHDMLHESIHAIFNRTPEECEQLKIELGTGISEQYSNKGYGTGFNEGLTEWICKKAGSPSNAYEAESNIVELFELAIGEDKVMQLAKGGIKRNVPELLQMTEEDTIDMLQQVDKINKKERYIEKLNRINNVLLSNKNNSLILAKNNEQLKKELGEDYGEYHFLMNLKGFFHKDTDEVSYLREYIKKQEKDCNAHISSLKEKVYLKYFDKEIEEIQNTTISKEKMKWLTNLYNNITEEHASDSKVLLRFKNEIYPKLQEKSLADNKSKLARFVNKFKKNIINKTKEYLTGDSKEIKTLPEPNEKTIIEEENGERKARKEFIAKYPTQKSEEEINREKKNKEPKVYYKLNDKEYEIFGFLQEAVKMQNFEEIYLPVQKKENGDYILPSEEVNKMDIEDAYKVLNSVNNQLMMSAEISGQVIKEQLKEDSIIEDYYRLKRQKSQIDYSVKKMRMEGKDKDANKLLNVMIEKILEFKDKSNIKIKEINDNENLR